MDRLIISSQDHIVFLNVEDIVFCKSDNCYTYVYLVDGKEILVSKSLAKFSKELKEDTFIRVSQSYLINKNFIKRIHKKKKELEMPGLHIKFTISIKLLMSQAG